MVEPLSFCFYLTLRKEYTILSYLSSQNATGPVAVALLEVSEKVSILALQTLGKVSNMRYNVLGKCTEATAHA